jgi:hypothetical protein
MIKRWLPVLLILALALQACNLPLSVPGPVASEGTPGRTPNPGEVTSTSLPVVTAVTTKIIPTQAVTDTPAPVLPTPAAPTATQTAAIPVVPTRLPMKYSLQPGTPVGLPSFVHTDLACKWMGVGGQVFALDSTPVQGLVVELGGTLAGQPISQLSLTGASTEWGPGGYEFTLASQPVESSGTLWLRALDLNGKPVSDKIFFTTYQDCSKNQVMINFIELQPDLGNTVYLTLIQR